MKHTSFALIVVAATDDPITQRRACDDLVARGEQPVDAGEQPVALVPPRREAEPFGVDERRGSGCPRLEQRDVREPGNARVESVDDGGEPDQPGENLRALWGRGTREGRRDLVSADGV